MSSVALAEASTAPFRDPSDELLHKSIIDPSLLLSRILVVIAFAAQIIIAWRYWALTWDDSAITLGFARTFALTGRIEPTPGSGIVEGYSTTLWMLLMTVAAKLASTPAALLIIAKISTLLLNLANILLIRRWFSSWTSETCANLIAGSVGCGLMFYETINGMETPIILALLLAMLLLRSIPGRLPYVFYLLAGSAFLLARWELTWLLVPFILVESTFRRTLISSFTWLSVFVVSNVVRYLYFGSILPNTIIAKRGPPYSNSVHGHEIARHLGEPAYILASCKILLLLLIVSFLYNRFVLKQNAPLLLRLRQTLYNSWQLRFTILFVLFSLVLSTAIGKNSGPEFRSFYSAWPFLFCLFLLPITSNRRSPALPWFTAVVCLFALLRMSVHIRELNSKDAPVYMPGATIADIGRVNAPLAEVASAAHHPNLVYAGADMGAVMLFAHGVRVVDLGLLCDPVLARQRYAAINSYVLQQRKPDVIEVHEPWTALTNFHNLPLFLSQYRPFYIDGKRLFVSRALIADIGAAHLTEKPFDAAGYPQEIDDSHTDSNYLAADYVLNRDFGTYLVFNNPTNP
jgi:hypothetical protein